MVVLGGFACQFGDRERTPDSIEGIQEICQAQGVGLSLTAMGCKTFWQMTRPIESYVVRCVQDTIAASGVAPADVDHVVFSTMDKHLRHLGQDFARDVLAETGLVHCMPVLLSMQQCAGSLAAVDHARRLLEGGGARRVIVVAFDFVPDDAQRVQPFALFGDAVASFMMTRADDAAPGGLGLLAYAADVDFAGLIGKDNFATRKQLVVATMRRALDESGVRLEAVDRCFTTNFFKPVALFNAGVCGVHRTQLAIDTLSTRAHCGNCDWILNLVHHQQQHGFKPDTPYLAQAFAPGFFACALLGPPPIR